MKKTILLFMAVILTSLIYAQQYDPFTYKMLVTDNGSPVANQAIDVKISIRKIGTSTDVVWIEEHNVTTDANGICSMQVGFGNQVGGSATNFYDINWVTSASMWYQMKVEVDTGNGYQTLVDWEDMDAVPLAKQADKAFRLDDQYGTTNYIGANGNLKFKNTGGAANSYKIGLDANDRLSFTYNSSEIMYFQGAAYANFIKDVKMEGKLLAPESGDADLKPYLYGKVYGTNGTVPPNGQSNTAGFTVTKTGTGIYHIIFDTPLNSYYDYIAIASVYGSTVGFVKTSNYASYLEVRTYNTSGSLADKDFTFVMFKK